MYTTSGFYSGADKSFFNDENRISEASINMKNLYKETSVENKLFFSEIVPTHFDIENKSTTEYPEIYMTANPQYLKKYGADYYKQLEKANIISPTVLLPEQYKQNEKDILDYFMQEYYNNLNYTNPSSVNNPNETSPEISVIYVENGAEVKTITDDGFSSIKNLIIMLDIGNFDGLYYFYSLQLSELFFNLNSEKELSKLLDEYNFNQLLVPASKLSPYITELEMISYELQKKYILSIMMLVTLFFIVFVSNYCLVLSNKKIYSSKLILGYSNKKILQIPIILSSIIVLLSLIAYLFNLNFLLVIPLSLFDMFALKIMYRKQIELNIVKIQKGG